MSGTAHGTDPPWVTYGTTVQLGELWGDCYHLDEFAMDSSGGTDRAGMPDVDGVATEACPPPGDFDGLQGVTWSISRYGDRYVQQINVPDPDVPAKVYVACFEFGRSQFECYPDSNHQFAAPGNSQNTQDLTTTVGQVCPSY